MLFWMQFSCLKSRPVTKGLFLTHALHPYHLIHSPHCSIKQKQSTAIMNSLYWKCRGKGSDVKQDGAALMLSVNFIEPCQTTLGYVLPNPREWRRVSPTQDQHTLPISYFQQEAQGVRGGKCNINSPLYYVLICSSSWLLHMTCPVICIASASHFLISQSLSSEVLFSGHH